MGFTHAMLIAVAGPILFFGTGSTDVDKTLQPMKTSDPHISVCPIEGRSNVQGSVDTGDLALVFDDPAYWLAGHNYTGWRWVDDLEVGAVVEVTCGDATGTYEVYDHEWQALKGGPIPEWAYQGELDMVLQTCTGEGDEPDGMGFSLLRET